MDNNTIAPLDLHLVINYGHATRPARCCIRLDLHRSSPQSSPVSVSGLRSPSSPIEAEVMARAGGITNAVNVGIAVQADWENREFISHISLNVRRLFDFLVQFGKLPRSPSTSPRCHLAREAGDSLVGAVRLCWFYDWKYEFHSCWGSVILKSLLGTTFPLCSAIWRLPRLNRSINVSAVSLVLDPWKNPFHASRLTIS